jgi:hypothetical protein
MKKTSMITLLLLLFGYSLFAVSSWIGVQTFTTTGTSNPALAIWGTDLEGESVASLAGANIAGSIYPVKRLPFGFGFQVGASEMSSISSNTAEIDLSEYPLAWRGSLSAQYHTHIFGHLSMELGMGLLGERMNKAVGSGNTEIRATLNSLGLLTSINMFLPLSDAFSLVGGIGTSLPIYTQRKISRGDNTDKANVDVEGITVHAQLGISLAL